MPTTQLFIALSLRDAVKVVPWLGDHLTDRPFALLGMALHPNPRSSGRIARRQEHLTLRAVVIDKLP